MPDKRPTVRGCRAKGTAPVDQAAGEHDRRRGEQRDDEMRRQVEDVRVADVVAEREDRVGRVQREHEDRAPPAGHRQLRQARRPPAAAPTAPNCCRRSNQYIAAWSPSIDRGTFITIVSRQSALVTSNQNRCERVDRAVRRVDPGSSQSVRRFHAYCERAGARRSAIASATTRGVSERSPPAAAPRAAGTPRRRARAESSRGGCRSRARRRRRTIASRPMVGRFCPAQQRAAASARRARCGARRPRR